MEDGREHGIKSIIKRNSALQMSSDTNCIRGEPTNVSSLWVGIACSHQALLSLQLLDDLLEMS
jgi:hypothetical protein